MRVRSGGLAAIIGLAALCFCMPAFGQNSITLTGVNGQTSGGNLCSGGNCEDVYTGIYYSTVDKNANTPTICDDFNHNVSIGETWNAIAINTSSLNAGNIGQTQFGSTIGIVGYAEIASLVNETFVLNNGSGTFDGISGVNGTDLSEAIWDITTKGGITGISSNASKLVAYVEAFYNSSNAQADLNKFNLWILTPAPDDGPQEFWAPGTTKNIVTPEGGAALSYLLLAGLACFGAMRFSSRNQTGRR